jgi:hypothetical protein
MISDPGTSPFKARPQFIFGASLAVIYAVLMLMNVVYTLFFATAILCAIRGLGWWTVHLIKRSKQRRAERAAQLTSLWTGQQDVGVVAA